MDCYRGITMLKFSGVSPEVQRALTCSWFSAGYVLLVGFEKYSVLQRILVIGILYLYKSY
jgi:hypothetical protein